jgi:hypothetical protein
VSNAPELWEQFLKTNDSREYLNLPDLIVLLQSFIISVAHHGNNHVELQHLFANIN